MNQGLLDKLKRVTFRDLLSVILAFLAVIPAVFYRKRQPDLWLISDCPNEARDNAFSFFKYLRRCHPEQKAVFALARSSPDMNKVIEIGEVVPYGSLRHWIYYYASRHVISSQKASGPDAAVCYILERFRLVSCNKIFLQHGIIKDNISFLYYKYTKIRLFTCSTLQEWKYVRENYGYPPNNVQLLGLCRFDELWHTETLKRQIVIMPTWRKYLSHPSRNNSNEKLASDFEESIYYKKWNELLCSEKFAQFLQENKLNAVFYLHREAQKFSHCFSSQIPQIKIGKFPEDNVQTLLKESMILITDYSSVAMDFAYMSKPLIYYQFDYDQFRKGHLAEGYFSYEEDGFGDVCKNVQSLLCSLLSLKENSMRISEKYQKRAESFFTLRDSNNCARTYEAIRKIL